ncbi:autotransporter outer membrane beta-barrel domain-containing protein [Thioclava atlantica]|uniref:Porin domain-containing protein n=1 Tax=Thioclava atlantica TaxID=1317124 RepID=A0A085U0F1_9RHOB|nr:autotransporter outer membrane beta-barrel domain-containing protein [Thioclava atlantica]KFE36448.1 hypothetical protein DW2_04029 [Thioclava atlantica]
MTRRGWQWVWGLAAIAASAGPAAAGPQIRFVGIGAAAGFGMTRGAQSEAVPEAGGGRLPRASGSTLSEGAACTLGKDGFLEWEGSIGHFRAKRTSESLVPSGSTFSASTGTLPSGTIKIDTAPSTLPPGAQGTAVVTAPGPSGTTVRIDSSSFSPQDPPGNRTTVFAYSPTAGGGSYIAMALDGQSLTAAGFGLIYDGQGIVVAGLGGPGWTRKSTMLRDTTTSWSQSLRIGRRIDTSGPWTLTPRVGLETLALDRRISQQVSYRLDPFSDGATLPAITLGQTERLRSHYLALTLGAGASRDLGDGWRLAVSLDAGRGRMHGTLSGWHNATIEGIAAQSFADPEQRYSTMTWTGRVTLGLSREIGSDTTLSIGLYEDYLSAVPTMVTELSPASGDITTGADSVSVDGGGTELYTRRVATRPQFGTGVSLSIVHRF